QFIDNLIILDIYFDIFHLPSSSNSKKNSTDNFRNKHTDNTNSDTGSGTDENRNDHTDDESHKPMSRSMEAITMVISSMAMTFWTMSELTTTWFMRWRERFNPVGKAT